jgi:predicted GH43/DUF377 family glycosyl hydrolase
MSIVTRFCGNPILEPNPANDWESLAVLNPAVIYDEERQRFIMLYRASGNDTEHYIQLGLATSEDGFHFKRESDKPCFAVDPSDADGGCIEDPRLVRIDGIYYMTYAGRAFPPGKYWLPLEEFTKLGYARPVLPESAPNLARANLTVSYLASTRDFKTFKRLGRITDSRYDDRDVLIFPERVNGKFVRISRPKFKDGRVKMPSVWITYGEDLLEWGEPELLFTGEEWWETARIGAACPPIKTDKGWLMLYHGVDGKVDDMYKGMHGTYRVGAVLLDRDNPSKILGRTKTFFMEPEGAFEKVGLAGYVVFPTGSVLKDGVLYIYYGCADSVIGVCTADIDKLIEKTLKNA